MYDLENLETGGQSLEQGASGRLTDSQMEYLRELQPSEQAWDGMTEIQRNDVVNQIIQRYGELPLYEGFNIRDSMEQVFDSRISEQYGQLEAPQDFLQIEAVGDTLAECQELRLENWQNLELNERLDVLNNLEERIAAIEHRTPCPVKAGHDMGTLEVWGDNVYGQMGGYRPGYQDITINAELIMSDNPIVHREMLDTLIHEGRHAYQDYNLHVCEVHPRHSEVESWRDTWGDGKWEYAGDCSTLIGQRLYEQQSIEIDARNFAADVLDNMNDKLEA